MKVVILAGGQGTRLRPLTYTRPKAMLPLAGKPILHHIINLLTGQGFNEFVITSSYKSELIRSYFGDGSKLNVSIAYSEERVPLGTAGGVKEVEHLLDGTFAVIQGDNVTEIDFADQVRFHKEKGAVATIAVKPVQQPWLFGVLELDADSRVRRFQEKPSPEECFSNLISTGLYVLEPEALDYIPKGKPFDFARDLFPALLASDLPLFGYRTDAFWVDVGTLDGYLEALRWILSKLPAHTSRSARVRGEIEGNVWIEDGATIGRATIRGPAFIGKAASIGNEVRVGPNSSVEESVVIERGSRIEGSVIYERTFVGEEVSMEGCIVGEDCEIGQGTTIRGPVMIPPGSKIGAKSVLVASLAGRHV